jgi:hypothetical protein
MELFSRVAFHCSGELELLSELLAQYSVDHNGRADVHHIATSETNHIERSKKRNVRGKFFLLSFSLPCDAKGPILSLLELRHEVLLGEIEVHTGVTRVCLTWKKKDSSYVSRLRFAALLWRMCL